MQVLLEQGINKALTLASLPEHILGGLDEMREKATMVSQCNKHNIYAGSIFDCSNVSCCSGTDLDADLFDFCMYISCSISYSVEPSVLKSVAEPFTRVFYLKSVCSSITHIWKYS